MARTLRSDKVLFWEALALVCAVKAHPLRIVEEEHGPSPRLLVRHGLEAELARPVYYELAEIALAENPDRPGVWSEGVFFPLEHEG